MAFNKEQIVPKSEHLDESFQSFASTVDQLGPNEELYDIKQEFAGDFDNEIEDSIKSLLLSLSKTIKN